ncbi:unnamed protein product [Bursaphelenchus okinawaensis]|uniref:PCI domain-containing protein n=1 Tax=Bursaphelenchus okinawaensis TaxID=465554 RepID=A0A811KVQ5_9BILA|nr:unnamed protein product [Bursaphelenchus okinawaensis]CAG9114083.1 unnamed protein product [Bursaphelenchus okinawaensis]
MPHSKLQLRVLTTYKNILRQLQKRTESEASLRTAREAFKQNAKAIEKSNFVLVEHNLRLAERRETTKLIEFAMSVDKLGGAFSFKNETQSSVELRLYFKEKGLKIDPNGSQNLFENVKELLGFAPQIAASVDSKELECVLNAIFNLSVAFEPAKTEEFIGDLIKTLNGKEFSGIGWNSQAGVAVRILSNVFHMYTDRPKLQLSVFKALVKIAGQARITKFTDTSIDQVENYVKALGLDVEGKRDLLRVLHKALLADARHDAAAEVMCTLLRTYSEVDANSAKDDAEECVRTAIIDPKSFTLDHLLRLSAVQYLKTVDPKMYEILQLFSTGTWSQYKQFVQSNPDFVKSHLKADEKVLEKKIKTLSLISLAEKNMTLKLDQLRQDLEIDDEEELEEFLIDAIQIKAVNGKINEKANEFVVTTYQNRTFDRPQWEILQKRISTLLKNVKKANENLHSLSEIEVVEN